MSNKGVIVILTSKGRREDMKNLLEGVEIIPYYNGFSIMLVFKDTSNKARKEAEKIKDLIAEEGFFISPNVVWQNGIYVFFCSVNDEAKEDLIENIKHAVESKVIERR